MKEKLSIGIPILDNVTWDKFYEYCEHFHCDLQKPKSGSAFWIIETDDPINFFWLGANLNFKHSTGIAISASSKYLGHVI